VEHAWVEVAALEDLDPVAPLALGGVAGQVHRAERPVKPPVPPFERHHSDARGEVKALVLRPAADPRHGGPDAFRDLHRLFSRAGDEQRELVAPQPRRRAAWQRRGGEQGGGTAKDVVASGVATAVVDFLELVEVNVEQRPAGLLAGGDDQAVELPPVEQAGQLVVRGLVGQLLGPQAELADLTTPAGARHECGRHAERHRQAERRVAGHRRARETQKHEHDQDTDRAVRRREGSQLAEGEVTVRRHWSGLTGRGRPPPHRPADGASIPPKGVICGDLAGSGQSP
jgi:hypothetical protein